LQYMCALLLSFQVLVSFPSSSVRVVVAFHNYTGTKDGNGPGANGNVSPSEGGFTWHWDDLTVKAVKAQDSLSYYKNYNATRIVTPDNCIAFVQGQREAPNNRDVSPRFQCQGDPDIVFKN